MGDRSAPLDLERFRLRRFVDSLGSDELERRDEPIELADIASVLEGNPRAVLFSKTGSRNAQLCGNVLASRSRMALAFGTTREGLLPELLRRLAEPPRIVEISREMAPVQSVVLEGDAADLTALPVHLQHRLDGAPYISAAIDYATDPTAGWTNVGIRRLMLRGRRKAGMDCTVPSDLRNIMETHARRGEPVPVAFVVGAHPTDYVAATMRLPVDELGLVASLRGAPLPVVKCITNELRVPADAEYVLEGFIDTVSPVEPEGPYGEFLGYYGEVKRNPYFRLSAITRREDALFQTATISGRSLACTDTAQLNALRVETVAWSALQTAVRDVRAVYATPASGGSFHVRIAMNQRVAGEARNAIAAVMGCLANVKHVFVVDPDIDIYSDEQVEWALATRFQADRDLVIQPGMRSMPLDPSAAGTGAWAKAGFDMTLAFAPAGQSRPVALRVPEPPRYEGKRHASLASALAEGPMFFEHLMAATGSRDGRDIVRALETMDEEGRIARDAEGRYFLK
ncbi:MAG: carboxylyase [Betaproteobacteria bacterium RIFCSPLOWO2_12_FULL_63_13]|nr:MAG: carboxylyase [Betaproteobacteria bacterium RIFCSPLOWO2_02_FULL_63_19]OGA46359.1 MAG: carboxylyase [Betaproteobacteria bacterium RIFCSPLOWO2_12_FULL_63_13]